MSALERRSIRLAGHPTSLALEPEFWAALEQLAAAKNASLAVLLTEIDGARDDRSLASAARVTALAAAGLKERGGSAT